jgi:hypothetical protein
MGNVSHEGEACKFLGLMTLRSAASAAARLHIDLNEYLQKLEDGLKFCTGCKEWHPRNEFSASAARYDGLHPYCKVCTSKEHARRYVRHPRPVLSKEDKRKRRLESKDRFNKKAHAAKFGPDAGDMRGRHENHARGAEHPRWNEGRMLTSHGYVAIKVPDGHHLQQAHGYAYEHDLVAEEMLGRRLLPDEVVHHKNEDKTDNDPGNLEVMTRAKHGLLHARIREAG